MRDNMPLPEQVLLSSPGKVTYWLAEGMNKLVREWQSESVSGYVSELLKIERRKMQMNVWGTITELCGEGDGLTGWGSE